ncbi:zona pellucida sperm-binding protein 4-like [Periophthalmus magnuspinnatus]|uniref:zona pellucida sperm-binding protein 4-like n=1 Tax=Periophthalmus magnuspinnatus TaxID=409849 RepID=UPI00243663E6|nr:zona pellucida sperm-binding protein 4-like [Periophthalmus magnuspinnatus]
MSFQKSKSHERKRQALPKVTCSRERVKAVFGPHVSRNVTVEDSTGAVIPVSENEESCGVKLTTDKSRGPVFLSKYDSCYTKYKDRTVIVPLRVQLKGKQQWFRVNVSCPLIKRHSDSRTLSQTGNALAKECQTPKDLKVGCGHRDITGEDCLDRGCCYDDEDDFCFYRLNSCSLDRHFVFSVTTEDTGYSTSLSKLMVKDQPQCVPVILTPDTAVFKVGQKECGAKMKEEGNNVIYEMEVVGGIDSAFSLEVACEYEASELKKVANLDVLFLTNPPPAVGLGNSEVQMRIARDASFTSFFAEDELPVTLPLRENVHVEISFVGSSPDPTLSLRVRDCFAYPETKHSVWNLLFDGCPNPLDDMQSFVPVDNKGKIAFHSQVRRFDVKTFAFLDPHTGRHSTELVYFYCWVEICTENMECEQHCSITSSESQRQRREALPSSDHLHLYSVGPLQLGQNDTDVDDNLCLTSKKQFQVTVYVLSGVGAALLLMALCLVFRSIRRCQRQAQALDAQKNTEQTQ